MNSTAKGQNLRRILIYVAVTDGHRTWVKKLNYPRSRDFVRITAVNNAYDMVRRFVIRDAQQDR